MIYGIFQKIINIATNLITFVSFNRLRISNNPYGVILDILYIINIYNNFTCSVDRNKYQIHIPLPPKIDPTVTMMQVEEKPDVTYSDVGGCKEQIEKLREVVETPLLHVRISIYQYRYLK